MVMLMIENLKKSFLETAIAVIPICFIVTAIALFFNFESNMIISFVASSIVLIIGISLFTFGADLSMMMIGERLGNKLMQSKKLIPESWKMDKFVVSFGVWTYLRHFEMKGLT